MPRRSHGSFITRWFQALVCSTQCSSTRVACLTSLTKAAQGPGRQLRTEIQRLASESAAPERAKNT